MAETLKAGGHFICKVFEITLPGTVQVLALLACLFERVALVKPVTSRPASAERYVVRPCRVVPCRAVPCWPPPPTLVVTTSDPPPTHPADRAPKQTNHTRSPCLHS